MRRDSPECGDAVAPAHPAGPGMEPPDARPPRRTPLGSRAARRAALALSPAPLLQGHGGWPRVLGLSLREASDRPKKAGLQRKDGAPEAHPTAPKGRSCGRTLRPA